MNVFNETPFCSDLPKPDQRFFALSLPPAPELPLVSTFGPRLAHWITQAAQSKSAPPDYIAGALITVAGSLIGNTRWVQAWEGWSEPPILWAMLIGSPSSGKSPALDAVIGPLRDLERELGQELAAEIGAFHEKAELAKIIDANWREATKAAIKAGEEPPSRPKEAQIGEEPMPPRFALADCTIERLTLILSKQPRGTLLLRDELSGWLQGMVRYSGGASDRPFWLEAYGGRAFTVERMGREGAQIDRLSVGVLGGIQPDRLTSLLMKTDYDGLLARLVPIWPEPAPLMRPQAVPDDAFISGVLGKLVRLQMYADERDIVRPWMIRLSPGAQNHLDTLRKDLRDAESACTGLTLSYVGKLPGFTLRLSLILTLLDWASMGAREEPLEVSAETFARAASFTQTYALPMAQRAYMHGSETLVMKSARKLVRTLQERNLKTFTSREIMRLRSPGLQAANEVGPAIKALEEGDVIRELAPDGAAVVGRKSLRFAVNPMTFE